MKLSVTILILNLFLINDLNAFEKTDLFSHSERDFQIQSDMNKLNVFVGIGIPPFKMQAGGGYFVNQNIEAMVKFSSMFIPAGFYADVVSLGVRYYENQNINFVYALEVGGVGSPDFFNGVYLETSAGYLIQTGIGFNTIISFRLGGLFRSEEKPAGLVGVDLVFGWNINF